MLLKIDISVSRSNWQARYTCEISGARVVGVIGRSGSGKSTLLRQLAGLDVDGQGDVQINSTLWQSQTIHVPTAHRNVAMVQQDYLLFPHLSVQQNLALVQKQSALPIADQNQIIDNMGIASWLSLKPGQLSGGQQQRVALVSAMLQKPRLLLLDEPLSALDFKTRSQVLQQLKNYLDQYQVPAIYVSHHLDEISSIADHCLLIQSAEIVLSAPTHEVLDHPKLEQSVSAEQFGSVLPIQAVKFDHDDHIMQCQIIPLADPETSGTIEGQTIWAPIDAILENSQLHMQLPAKNIVLAHKPIEGSSFQNCLSGKIVRLVQEFDHVLVIVRVDGHDLKVIVSKRAQRQLELSEQQLVYCHTKSVSLLTPAIAH